MSAKDFIINTLKSWESFFPGIIVKYSFDEKALYHIITVEPSELYSNNKEYIEEESRFWDEFQVKFPDEALVISEPNGCLEMTNQLYPTIPAVSTTCSLWSDVINAYRYKSVYAEAIRLEKEVPQSSYNIMGQCLSYGPNSINKYALAA